LIRQVRSEHCGSAKKKSQNALRINCLVGLKEVIPDEHVSEITDSPSRAISRLLLATMIGFCPAGNGFGWLPASSESASPRDQPGACRNPAAKAMNKNPSNPVISPIIIQNVQKVCVPFIEEVSFILSA
jgi:hypothetical protein